WFLGFNLQAGADGSIYMIDWYDSKECHGQTPEGRATGRIFKITYGEPKYQRLNLLEKTSQELARLQLDPNDWMVRHARRLLAERAAKGEDMTEAKTELIQILEDNPELPRRLRALWTL